MYGAAFGLFFPLLGTVVRVLGHSDPVSLKLIAGLHMRDHLLQIIDTAPLVLGGFAYIIGRGRQRVVNLLDEMKAQAGSFERFYPKQFVTLLGRKTVHQVKPGDHAFRDMTILFSDIRGYTSMSESMDSDELFEIMRDYFEWVSPIFLQNEGFIDKYIGDSIMAIFPRAPEDAVKAAGQLMHHLRSYNEMASELNRPPIRIGAGIHTGPLSIGTIGAGNRLSTTVMGDVVNLASRIEGLTRKFHVPVILTDTVYFTLGEAERENSREIAIARVRGHSRRVTIYEYFAGEPDDIRERKQRARGEFMRALVMHRRGEHLDALRIFESIHVDSPQDPVPVLYIEQCKKHANRSAGAPVQVPRILIIDDNPAIADLFRAFLRGRPMKIFTAETGAEALKFFENEAPDQVFIDFHLPDMDGVALLKQLLLRRDELQAATLFIAMTAEEEAISVFKKAGASQFLAKPMKKPDILNAVDLLNL